MGEMRSGDIHIRTTVTTEIALSIDQAADWFCGLDDDQMARFFVAVAARAKTWGPYHAESMWHYVGGHLRNCECSTDDAREMVRGIAHALEHSTHGARPSPPQGESR